MHEDELQQIGLSEKEAKVYLAALQLGKASAQEVAHKSRLKRPTTYFTIEILMEKGLMSSIYEGKKQFFMAENPDRLMDVYEKKRDEMSRQGEKLKKLIPNLKKVSPHTKGGPVVKYYTGKEGALSMVKELLSFKGDDIWLAYPHETIVNVFTHEELEEMRFTRKRKDINIKGLYTSESEILKDNKTTRRARLDGKQYKLPADIAVYGNMVRLTSFENGIVGIVIENKEIADTLRTLFALAWKSVNK